jgi:hypothetical protein
MRNKTGSAAAGEQFNLRARADLADELVERLGLLGMRADGAVNSVP